MASCSSDEKRRDRDTTKLRLLAEIGHSQIQNRPPAGTSGNVRNYGSVRRMDKCLNGLRAGPPIDAGAVSLATRRCEIGGRQLGGLTLAASVRWKTHSCR